MLSVLLLLGAVSSPVPLDSDPERVTGAFLAAVSAADPEPLAPLITASRVTLPAWKQLRDELETYECVSIGSHVSSIESVTDAAMRISVTLQATAIARGATRAPLRYPSRWFIDLVSEGGEWRFERVLTAERSAAQRLFRSGQLTEAAIMAAARDLDLERFLATLSDEISITGTKAVPTLQIILSIARRSGLAGLEVKCLRDIAYAYLSAGYQAVAADWAATAARAADAFGDADARALAYLAAGTTAWTNGRDEEALARWVVSSGLLDVCRDPRHSMKAMYMQGLLLVRRGAVADVLLLVSDLDAVTKRFRWTEGRCIAGIQRWEAYTTLFEHDAARAAALDALEAAERLRNPSLIAVARSNLAVAEKAVGNHSAAVNLMQLIIDANVDPGSAPAAESRTELASLLFEQGRYEEAETEYLRAREAACSAFELKLEAQILAALARLRLATGKPEEALRLAEEADAIIRNRTGSVVAGIIGGDNSWFIRATLGNALAAAGFQPEAIEALRSSIELIESRRADLGTDDQSLAAFMQDKATPYRALVALLVDENRLEEAVIVSERLRARALGTAVARGGVRLLPSLAPADRARYDALNDSVAAWNRKLIAASDERAANDIHAELAQARLELRSFLLDLYAKRPDIRARNVEDPQLVLDDAKRLVLHGGEALLAYMVHENETFVFFMERRGTGTGVQVKRLAIGQKQLQERIDAFASSITSRRLDYGREARALYDLLVQPFGDRIASKRLLYVVPDGVLWRLPFHVLQNTGGQHLVENVAVAYAPSLALLRTQRPEAAAGPIATLLAVADPLLPATKKIHSGGRAVELSQLSDARREVRTIADLYSDSSRVLIGENATEESVKKLSGDARVLHLATHGIIDDASPMHSSILLTASGAEDGLLEAREILNLHLRADVAVLSTCDSARGGLSNGEGIMGISWALMVAGCRNTIVSQWKVASRSTADLMIAFHGFLRAGETSYAAALRKAQLAIMSRDEYAHPFYWSPFVLIATSQ
jgi:CHAT domain-containing protein